MTKVNFLEQCLHMTVKCVENYSQYILAGIGNDLFVFENETLYLRKRIFKNERVHSICVKNDTIVLKGGRELAVICLQKSSNQLDCHILYKIKSSDWIQDVTLLNNENFISLTTAHNSFEVWDINLKKYLEVCSCEENCILYSCKIIGNTSEDVIVFSGTVFGDVLIWAPCFSSGNILQRIRGHNGAVFSITVNVSNGTMCTTSDDRSLKVWSLNEGRPILCPENLKKANVQLTHTLFAHTARVWQSLIVSDFYVTIGEDSKLIIWSKNGKLIKCVSLHQESGIRALNYSKENNKITTGGEDGGIITMTWEFLAGEIQPKKLLDIIQNFSTKVCFINEGLVYSQNGGCVIVSNLGEKFVYFNKNFESYCQMEVSQSGDYIVMGSMKGHLVVIHTKTNNVIANEECLSGRVYSIHWLNESFLTCCSDGRLNLWQLTEKGLTNLQTMTLPKCKERWTTCGALKNKTLLVGDRMGNVYIFDIGKGGDPIHSFQKTHSYLGVTDAQDIDDFFLTVGRDGTLKTFVNCNPSLTYKLPIEWPCKIVSYKSDILVLGFHSVFFIVWSMNRRDILATHDCGGGHRSYDFEIQENHLSFLYLKEKKVFVVDIPLNDVIDVRKGFHGKEVNCLKMFPASSGIIVSGGEDTTLRISRIQRNEMYEINVLTSHVSSIRAVSVCSIDSQTVLIISAGSKGQMVIHFYNISTGRCREAANHRFRNKFNDSIKSKNNSVGDIDSDTRFMCIDVLNKGNEFLIVTGCSDCQVRLFSFKEELKFLCSAKYTHCILKIHVLKVNSRVLIVSMGTDGHVVFWEEKNTNDLYHLQSFFLHQSGINSFEFTNIEKGKYILATGGDDNLICISIVEFSEEKLELHPLWKSSTAHSCQITGINIIKNYLLTTSIDQTITVWKWSLQVDNEFRMEFLDRYLTSIPDIHGMEAKMQNNGTLLIVAYGKGVESLEIDVSQTD